MKVYCLLWSKEFLPFHIQASNIYRESLTDEISLRYKHPNYIDILTICCSTREAMCVCVCVCVCTRALWHSCDTGHYLVTVNVRERLSVNRQHRILKWIDSMSGS